MGEGTIANAILDRLVTGARGIDLKGESLRKKSNSLILLIIIRKKCRFGIDPRRLVP
ncbi:MAG: hypothetical protein R6X28_09310 [Bacteroidales bacterium]